MKKISELKSGIIMKQSDLYTIIQEKLPDERLSEILFKIVVYYNFVLSVDYNLTRKKLSIRDVLNFIEFYNTRLDNPESKDDSIFISDIQKFREGIKLIIIDGFGIDTTADKDRILNDLEVFINNVSGSDEMHIDDDLKVTHNSD